MVDAGTGGIPNRRVVDELPASIGLLPGELDLVFRYFAAELDVLLDGSDICRSVPECNDES